MNCKICGSKSVEYFRVNILNKYESVLFKCYKCSFIQSEEPFWLGEAYGNGAIGMLDVGVMARNIKMANFTKQVIDKIGIKKDSFIAVDYGGGHGIFVRMMRDIGYNFYRYDLYADNLYARCFDVSDLKLGTKFDFLTSFEVFEHLPNPISEIEKMISMADILLFSTELQPSEDIEKIRNWWYLVPEGGQHVSFFSKNTLLFISKQYNLNLYTNDHNLHVLSKHPLQLDFINKPSAKLKMKNWITSINKVLGNLYFKRQNSNNNINSLIESDYNYVLKKNYQNGI